MNDCRIYMFCTQAHPVAFGLFKSTNLEQHPLENFVYLSNVRPFYLDNTHFEKDCREKKVVAECIIAIPRPLLDTAELSIFDKDNVIAIGIPNFVECISCDGQDYKILSRAWVDIVKNIKLLQIRSEMSIPLFEKVGQIKTMIAASEEILERFDENNKEKSCKNNLLSQHVGLQQKLLSSIKEMKMCLSRYRSQQQHAEEDCNLTKNILEIQSRFDAKIWRALFVNLIENCRNMIHDDILLENIVGTTLGYVNKTLNCLYFKFLSLKLSFMEYVDDKSLLRKIYRFYWNGEFEKNMWFECYNLMKEYGEKGRVDISINNIPASLLIEKKYLKHQIVQTPSSSSSFHSARQYREEIIKLEDKIQELRDELSEERRRFNAIKKGL